MKFSDPRRVMVFSSLMDWVSPFRISEGLTGRGPARGEAEDIVQCMHDGVLVTLRSKPS